MSETYSAFESVSCSLARFFFCHFRSLCFTSFGSSTWAIALYLSLQVILRIPFHAHTHIHITSRETDSTTNIRIESELTFLSLSLSLLLERVSFGEKPLEKKHLYFHFLGLQTFYYVECKINLLPASTRTFFCSALLNTERLNCDCHCRNSWPYVCVCVLYEKWKSRMVFIYVCLAANAKTR